MWKRQAEGDSMAENTLPNGRLHYCVLMKADSSDTVPGQNMRFSDVVIDDAKLSLAAKGVFTALGFLGNGCTVADISKRTADGEDVVRAALDELVREGYIDVEDDTVHTKRTGNFGLSK